MLIPAGIPLPENVSTSKDVKSGLRKVSFSNSLDQGRRVRNPIALSTRTWKTCDIGRFTTETKLSNSERMPVGSR